jgi:predicted lipid-binding transport protein (Tim44 family)
MAQEKLGREAMMTQAYTQGLPIIGEPASERFNRLELDLRRDVADSESVLDLYGRDIQKYGIDMQAAVAANNALMSFYSQLMGGMMGGLGNLGGNINYTSNIG